MDASGVVGTDRIETAQEAHQFEVLPLEIIHCGSVPYQEALELQQSIHKEVISSARSQTLLICEHPPVITHGKSANPRSRKR